MRTSAFVPLVSSSGSQLDFSLQVLRVAIVIGVPLAVGRLWYTAKGSGDCSESDRGLAGGKSRLSFAGADTQEGSQIEGPSSGAAKRRLTPAQVKWVVLTILVLQNAGANLFYRLATIGKQEWNPQTGVLLGECIKAALCALAIWFFGGRQALRNALVFDLDALKTGVPALLYLIQNNLLYVSASYLDAATFAIVHQTKILTTALLSILILGTSLSRSQWVALFLLAGGAVLAVLPDIKPRGSEHEGSILPGICFAVLACTCSGLSSVYFEKLLKHSSRSLQLRNFHMALFSMVLGAATLFQAKGLEPFGPSFFRGYTPAVVCSVLTNAIGGLLVAASLKYGDTILKNFATTLAIFVTMGASFLLLGTTMQVQSMLGAAAVVYSIFLYSGMSGEQQVKDFLARLSSGGPSNRERCEINLQDADEQASSSSQRGNSTCTRED